MTTATTGTTTTSFAHGAVLLSIDPATGHTVGEVPVTAVEAVPELVARARHAQSAWAALGPEGRREALKPAGAALVNEAEAIGELLTREMGKPLKEAIGEVRSCGSSLDETLDEIAAALRPDVLEDQHVRSTVHFDPFGVCAVIAPWNFPLAMPHWMTIPALMAGNTVVMKPSEETPIVAQAYVDLLNRHLPADVLIPLHGSDAQGKALVAADIDLIAFTGSRAAGRQILAAAGRDLKRVVLELGGKDPMIVLDDADLEAAAAFAVRNSFRNAGQVCVSTERIYVDDRVADAFVQRVVELTKALVVGPGDRAGVDVGPMINARQRQHVVDQVADAVRRGARVLAGGEAPSGNFVAPTVLVGVTPDMPIMQEETFGPVACIARFQDVDEAVRCANDSPYGLGAAVFGRDEDRAAGVARRLDAGMIGVNKGCGGAAGTPWVGAKQSGYGYHGSKAGHRQFAQARVVSTTRQPA
ncbi:MAG: aldehyde dehydrogenase [Phycisphaerales bacterium]|nr:aldehyde dehydrogenase [Phycisphaerales bacterium]